MKQFTLNKIRSRESSDCQLEKPDFTFFNASSLVMMATFLMRLSAEPRGGMGRFGKLSLEGL
jgi:hypothetical protein